MRPPAPEARCPCAATRARRSRRATRAATRRSAVAAGRTPRCTPRADRARAAAECRSPSSSGISSMPSVRARCARAWRSRLKDPSTLGRPLPLGGVRALASAVSICRAFWKSPRHSSPMPWHASAVRIVGRDAVVDDDDLLRRRRAAFGAPARRARLAVLGPADERRLPLELGVLLGGAARLVDRIFALVLARACAPPRRRDRCRARRRAA